MSQQEKSFESIEQTPELTTIEQENDTAPVSTGVFNSGRSKLPKWLLPVAALGLGGAVAGGIAVSGGSSESPQAVIAEGTDYQTEEPIVTPEPTTTTSEVEVVEETDPSMLPVLITGNTPEEIFEQFVHNRKCAYNAPTYEEQVDCLTHYVGDLANAGNVAAAILETIHDLNDYRSSSDPDYKLELEVELLDSELKGGEFTAVVSETDHGGTAYRRFHFRRTTASVESLSTEDETIKIWILKQIEVLDPGEVNF